jgi:hypothetical protein
MMTNWRRNELQAAKLLGLSTAEQKLEHGKVRQLDIEMDDGGRVVLTIMRSGRLSIQTFRESSLRSKSLYQLAGAAVVDRRDLAEWAETLHEKVRPQPCINAITQGSTT